MNLETYSSRPDFILSISPYAQDHAGLDRVFQDADWGRLLRTAGTPAAARMILESEIPAVVICEREVPPGTWRDVLRYLSTLRDPPLLIVTSRLADEHLWAEALNLGAFDVLAKPFDATEVLRVVGYARVHWAARHGHPRVAVAGA